jgi:hypothetical protein
LPATTLAKVAITWSISASVCAAETEQRSRHRRLGVPGGKRDVDIDTGIQQRVPHHDGGGLVLALDRDDRAHLLATHLEAELAETVEQALRIPAQRIAAFGFASQRFTAAIDVAIVAGDDDAVNM